MNPSIAGVLIVIILEIYAPKEAEKFPYSWRWWLAVNALIVLSLIQRYGLKLN